MAYRVLDYSFDALKKCFSDQAQAHDEVIHSKQHLVCFENYLSHQNVKTIILEEEYINRDFLEDFSKYYVKSFKPYKKTCIRLHFFNIQFTEAEFSNILKREPSRINIEELQSSYVGNVVLKPLPTTIIGKTCIETYSSENNRSFPTIRKYEFNLYGIPLSVKTLAYQEQDSIVSACASSAIWSVFHGTGMLFQHYIPSPVEITNWATKYFPFANRHFPNKGLSGEQMAIAIREVGLEPYLFNVSTYDSLKATVYAYLKGKIPIVLGFGLWDITMPKPFFGNHAVAITGFSLGGVISNKFENITNLTLTSSKVDKLFVHDDQVGPFARMDFSGYKINGRQDCLETTWYDKSRKTGNIKATPEIIILPLYHKIRIPFEAVLISIYYFNDLCIVFNSHYHGFPIFEWDIYLSNIKDFKGDVLSDSKVDNSIRYKILTSNFPKYLWRAIGSVGNDKKIEFIFDATDIDQGSFFLTSIVYDSIIESQFKVVTSSFNSNRIENLTTKAIIDFFK